MSSTSPIVLRPARDEEHAALTELCLRSKAIWGYGQAFMDHCRAELTLGPEDCGSPDLIVAERNRTVVGLAEIAVDDQECQLDKLFVDPDQQTGGVGKQLLHWAADRARELGQSEMIIESDPGAEGFYKRCGAIPAGTVPSGSIAGRTLPRLILPLA